MRKKHLLSIAILPVLSVAFAACSGDDSIAIPAHDAGSSDGSIPFDAASAVDANSDSSAKDAGTDAAEDGGTDANAAVDSGIDAASVDGALTDGNVPVDANATTFTVGGKVAGLFGTGLVIQLNGTDDLTFNADNTFTFTPGLANLAMYTVTVKTHPTKGACMVNMGTGSIAGANVTNVDIECGVGKTWGVNVGPGGNNTFDPPTLTIGAGDTVTWTWQSSGHSVTSGTACVADNTFCSPLGVTCNLGATSAAGATYSHFFGAFGTFPYFCTPHCGAGMTGSIISR